MVPCDSADRHSEGGSSDARAPHSSQQMTPHLGGRETTTSRALPLSYPHVIQVKAEFDFLTKRGLGAPFLVRIRTQPPKTLLSLLRRKKASAGGLMRSGGKLYLVLSTFMDPAPLQHHIDRLYRFEEDPGEMEWDFLNLYTSYLSRAHSTIVTFRFTADDLREVWGKHGHPASLTGGFWLASLFQPGTWNAALRFTSPDHFNTYIALH